ncbi:MAG TPA: TM0106 family RecB-like putative nuclease [Cyclobacteriaceae bacterium]|nr:TM0106 family RecB-like putative nuclease [Cyclobacteriaceae bacterium]
MKIIDNKFELAATDLSNHLSCRHLTELNRKVAKGELNRPHWTDPSLEVLEKRGRDHEAAYVDFLTAKGLRVENIDNLPVAATLKAMAEGVDVIVQARLEKGQWMGKADILLKVPGESKFGNWLYEVQDTKLAMNTRAGTILQLCLYTELLTALQGVEAEKFHVIKPVEDFEPESYRFSDFKAYYRLTKKNFEGTIENAPKETYPEPAEHCGVCRWWKVCDTRRRDDDYLSLVAGMRSSHIEELKGQGVRKLEEFAKLEKLAEPKRGNIETYERRQAQAKIQLEGRVKDKLIHSELAVEPGRGLNRLPEPNKGDVYFDIEGDAYYPNGGLEYILGYAFKENNELVYRSHWSKNKQEEKKAFENFMSFISDRWKKNPNMYIYHFAPYEPTAVKRLARVHAIYEKEVDDLLRAERFIDLHAVFKESLLASVETYSLKALELFTNYKRIVELPDASRARKNVEVALEMNLLDSLDKETLKTTEDYNKDDCLATHALHDWLEKLRIGKDIKRPEIKTGEATENVQQQETRSLAIFKSLISVLPEDRNSWTEEHKVKWLLAHQIDYFRREDKSAWWEFFRVHELEPEDLLGERKALTGLKYIGEAPKKGKERNVTHRYSFPPQEHSIDEGDELWEVKGEKIGSVRGISLEDYTIDIKKTATSAERHPTSIHISDRIDPGSLATSLMDLAAIVDESGLDHKWPNHAAKDLLMRRSPVLKEGTLAGKDDDVVAAAIRVGLSLDKSFLAIQGPPGSGKTYTGAKMIIELSKQGKKIGVTAISHKVIRNLIDKVIELSKAEGYNLGFVHKVTNKSDVVPEEVVEVIDSKKAIDSLSEGKVVGGTAWLWADANSAEKLDYLFIDEAGQMSLSHALAASRAAHNLILLGDPQQLEQPQKGAHPEGSDVAALTYLLDGRPTISEEKGLFLGITRRLHPEICKFTSELYYEGKLNSLPGLEKQVVSNTGKFDGAGLFYVPVNHRGNSNISIEEIDVVESIVKTVLKGNWCERPLTLSDILIVAPYNAQVSALIERLPGMRIGTVDKFQGQEAPVVIYSMTSSSQEDAPRGMSFLFSPNRLNVATSRAKSVSILVATPRLLEPECRSIDQMKWANGLCRYLEMVV